LIEICDIIDISDYSSWSVCTCGWGLIDYFFFNILPGRWDTNFYFDLVFYKGNAEGFFCMVGIVCRGCFIGSLLFLNCLFGEQFYS